MQAEPAEISAALPHTQPEVTRKGDSMNDYIDSILTEIKETISNHFPPVVRYNKNTKRISVSYDFDAGYIKKVKLIASSEKWLDLINEYPENLTYTEVEPLLSRPSKDLQHKLQEYAQDRQDDFTTDVLICIDSANMSNPLFKLRVIPRKNSYDLTWREKNQITMLAGRLYVFLNRIGRTSEKTWPDYFKRFIETYEIKKHEFRYPDRVQQVVVEVVSKYEGREELFDDSYRFFQTFVKERIKIRKLEKLQNISPEKDPILKEFFKEFF